MAVIERVKTLDAVYMDVDEPGDDVVMFEDEGMRAGGLSAGTDIDNAIAVDGESAGREDPVRQHQSGA